MTTKNPEDMNDDELEAAENAARGDSTQESTESSTTDETTTGETETGKTGTDETGTTETTETTTSATTETTGQAGETTTTETTDTKAAAETAGAETGKVAGVASKDGTRVLPYSALQAERRSRHQAVARAERAEKESERLKGEVEALRAGKSTESGSLTEEEVQRMEADFPEVGAKMRKLFEQNQELAKQVKEAKPSKDETEEVADDPVQEIIDQVPLLVEWQHDPKHADKWQRAIDHDALLMKSPKWKDKDPLERFTEATRRTAEEFDIEMPQTEKAGTQASSKTPPAKQTPDPAKKAVESAQRQPPSTLSDLKGGAVPDHGQVDFTKMPAQKMLGRFMDMDDAAIDRHLAKLG